MLKYFTQKDKYNIELIDEVSIDDIATLKSLFTQENFYFTIHCKNIYIVPGHFIELLYEYVYILEKKIELISNKARFTKYLHKLGFRCLYKPNTQYKNIKNVDINIVAIGGSANSSEKVIEILSGVDTMSFSIFVIQHISIAVENRFDLILSQYVNSQVVYAQDGMNIEKGYIYLAPKDKHMLISKNKIVLDDSQKIHAARPSISVSFESLSNEYRDNFLAILTCGYMDDGVDSLQVVKKNSSTILIQNPLECEADSIPREAISQGVYSYKFKTKDIITYINVMQQVYTNSDVCLKKLLLLVHEKYEYDFRSYNRDSIARRVKTFMLKNEIKSMKFLFILVLFHKSIFQALFLDLSINVTEFFRKELASQRMIELMKKNYKNCYNIKIWSAGCSNGSEIYSTAIILSELGLLQKSIIYATDINPVIIEEAKNGFYELGIYENIYSTYKKFGFKNELDLYLNVNDLYLRVDKVLREKVLFFVHNLEHDSVFNEFDIIECKNVIIYFDRVLQEKVFKLFYDSLKFGGYLFLGESEELPLFYKNKFEKYDENCKVYRKII